MGRNASNNSGLVSGKGALDHEIYRALAVAQAAIEPVIGRALLDPWLPTGPKGRFAPFLPYFWSVLELSKNKDAPYCC